MINRIFNLFGSWRERGGWLRLRAALSGHGQLLKLSSHYRAKIARANRTDRILVVGGGVAALAFLQELQREGFTNVTVVSKDKEFGGKCVHWGCMPMEFVQHSAGQVNADQIQKFVSDLAQDVQNKFLALGYNIIVDTVEEVVGNEAVLRTGERIQFDRLLLATGSGASEDLQQSLKYTSKAIDLAGYWAMKPGESLIIVSEKSPAAYSLADCARMRGIKTTLVYKAQPALHALPAFKYFSRRIQDGGVDVKIGARLGRITEDALKIEIKGQIETLEFNKILFFDQSAPKLLKIDQVIPDFFELDLSTGTLPRRPDVSFLGDAGGMMSSTEAELHAQELIKSWVLGQPMNLVGFEKMPVRLHAQSSLAWVGQPWALGQKTWGEIDFRSLGYTKISGEEGRLWYLFDRAASTLTALQICHPKAGDLIGIASALIDEPIDSLKWQTASVHPGAAEIFKALIAQIKNENSIRLNARTPALVGHRPEMVFELPPLENITNDKTRPNWLSQQEMQRGSIFENPTLFFGLLYGCRTLLSGLFENNTPTIEIAKAADGGLVITGFKDLTWHAEPDLNSIVVESQQRRLRVLLNAQQTR